MGYAAALAAVVTIAFLAKYAIDSQANAAEWVSHTLAVKARIASLLSSVKDAETSQRGYLLTGQPEYLEPFESAAKALPGELKTLAELTADNPAQHSRLTELEAVVREKFTELRETIELRRSGNAGAALAIVLTGRGKNAMDRIRVHVQALGEEEDRLLVARLSEWESRVPRSTIGLFRESLYRKGFLGLGSRETLRFAADAAAFTDLVREERIYQKC